MLGGRRSFGEGGWSGTPIAELLPVALSPAWSGGAGEGEPFFAEIKVEPTAWGKSHPALQLASTEEASLEVWQRLPRLSTFNPLTQLKPGATSLLVGKGEGLPGEQVVLAYQRYGRGKSLAWSVQDSWLWQMHADIPVEDQTHETLWRQLLRWLVSYVPEPVEVARRLPTWWRRAARRGARRGARRELPARQQRERDRARWRRRAGRP